MCDCVNCCPDDRVIAIRATPLARAWLAVSNAADVANHNGDVYASKQLIPIVTALKTAIESASSSDEPFFIRVD